MTPIPRIGLILAITGAAAGAPAQAWAAATVSASQTPAIVRPGQADVALMSIRIDNDNILLGSFTLQSLRLTNTTVGPGSAADRDAELGVLRLYRDTNGNGVFDETAGALLAQSAASGGTVTFAGLDESFAPGTTRRYLVVMAGVPAVARDGDALDLAIATPGDIGITPAQGFGNGFPVAPAGAFPVDGMTAFQIGVGASGTASLLAGTANNLVFHVVLPANGYEPDQLQQLTLYNAGTALAGSDVTAFNAWVDDGNKSFSPSADRLLGTLAFTGGQRWQLTGLAEPVGRDGLRLLVSADVGDFAVEGRTIQLVLPAAPETGVGVASGNDGPIDRAVSAPVERAVSTANRVTLTAASIEPAVVRPGQTQVRLLQLAAANSYSTTQTLRELIVTNAGVGGSIAERDRAIQALTLRLDGDGDGVLGSPAVDPPLATAFFSDGRAAFGGLNVTLPPDEARGLFVVADVSLTAASDGDTLSARIAGPLDVRCDDTTRVVAGWPLDSRARAVVDGMVAAQLALAATPAATLAPGDSQVVALDLRIPRNGHRDDLLHGLELVNLGTATGDDVAELRLWRDGGDGAFTPGSGDDLDLGAAAWTGTSWRSATLALPLAAPGARVFAVLRIAAAPLDGATLRLAIPLLGVTVESGNDGPLDAAVAAPAALLISNSPLLASLAIEPGASTAGQTVTVTMAVRNTGEEAIVNVAPSPLVPSGPGGLAPASGPAPASLTLAPGAVDTIRWTFVADTPGTLTLTGNVSGSGDPSGTPRVSRDATSNEHRVHTAVTSLAVTISTSLPPTVNRGQAGVVPLTLRVPAGADPDAAPVRLRALRLRLEDEPGAGVVPDQLLARVAVHEGTTERLSRTGLESSGAEIDLTLASPAVIAAGEALDLTVSFDLLAATTETAFRTGIASAAWIEAEDAHTGAAIPVQLAGGAFPVITGLARVVEASARLDVDALPAAPQTAGPGQSEVPLLALRFSAPGVVGITNDVRVTSLAFDADDTTGARLPALAGVLGTLRVRTAFQTLAARAVFASDGPSLTLLLSPALSVPVETPIDVFVSGDVAAAAPPGAFRLRLADSTRIAARDAVSQDPVPVVMASDPLPGPATTVQEPADSLAASGTPRMPAAVRAGDANIAAMTVRLRHPGGAGTAAQRVDHLVLRSRDQQRRALAPGQYLDRIRVTWNGAEAGVANDPPDTGETTLVPLGRTIAAGDSAVLEVQVDFTPVAPEGFLELWLFGPDIAAADANLGTPVAVVPGDEPLPLFSGLARIQAPARVLTAGLASAMPAALAGDGREIVAARLTLTNTASAGAGEIAVGHLVTRAGDRAFADLALGALAERVSAWANGAPWAASGPLTPDSVTATLAAAAPLSVAPEAPVTVELRIVPRPGTALGSLRLRLDAAGIGVVQPGSALLQIAVLPAPGHSFPLWTEAGSFSPADLVASYSNFPNPFAAGRQTTRFAFFLPAAARTWLRVVTLAGETVATLVDGEPRGAGLQQDDRWDGRNGSGRPVRNGVYVAELTVRFDDGTEARALRKVAVVR